MVFIVQIQYYRYVFVGFFPANGKIANPSNFKNREDQCMPTQSQSIYYSTIVTFTLFLNKYDANIDVVQEVAPK